MTPYTNTTAARHLLQQHGSDPDKCSCGHECCSVCADGRSVKQCKQCSREAQEELWHISGIWDRER